MSIYRRQFMNAGAALGGLLFFPRLVFAARQATTRPDAAFATEAFEEAITTLFGSSNVAMNGQVTLKAPDIAENGAVVPLGISSSLEQIDTIAVFIKGNPNPLTASFDLGPGAVADISTRVKMGKSSMVLAVVRADGKLYGSEKEVKVTIGGCGG